MKILPAKELKFNLIDSKAETIERLKRRTEFSEKMISSFTDKSFRGIVKEDEFKIISSEIGIGALCVMNGKLEEKVGYVDLEINKAFQILFSIFLILPVFAVIFQATKEPNNTLIFILIGIGQILMIRYVFIGYFFSKMSKHSLNRLRDVLDIEYF